jgi:3-methyladenine DNA glycosylase/8-oxoguanine DNA glycosylase
MLFAYERLRAFPIDVLDRARVEAALFFGSKESESAGDCGIFSESYFGEHGGYAQQYLFHHARSSGRGDRAIEANRPRTSDGVSEGRGGSPEPPAQVVRAYGLR